MVEMRVRQDHGVDARRLDREGIPVAQAELLQPLEQTAIDEDPPSGRLDQVAGARDRAGAAEEGEMGMHVPKFLRGRVPGAIFRHRRPA